MDNLNLIGSLALCKHAETLLTAQFDMKLLGKTSYCLGLQVHHFPGRAFLHQQNLRPQAAQVFSNGPGSRISGTNDREEPDYGGSIPTLFRGGEDSEQAEILPRGWSFHVPDHTHEARHRLRNEHTRETQPKANCSPLERSITLTPLPTRY
jgi:hypothetical protein